MGLLNELFMKRGAGPTILELLKSAWTLFPGGSWVDIDMDKVFDGWNTAYEAAPKNAIDPNLRAQADHWRDRMREELGLWQKYRDLKPKEIAPELDRVIAHDIDNLLKNLKELLQSQPKEYQDVSSTMLKIVAAGLWNKEIGWVWNEAKQKGLAADEAPEPLSHTIIKLRLAFDADQASKSADLPDSLKMDPQENPAAYWGSKVVALRSSLTQEEQMQCTGIFDALKALHADQVGAQKLGKKDREAALGKVADNVAKMVPSRKPEVRVLLPIVAEATREVLGCPRGARVEGAPEKGSKPLTPADRDAIRRDVDARSGWR